MRINSVNSFNILSRNFVCKHSENSVNKQNYDVNYIRPTVENIKACYFPSFKGFLPYKLVSVCDRETKMPKTAVILKDDVGKFTSFELYVVGEKERAGFLNFRNDFKTCEIRHIRTLDAGKKYSGIGTALLSCAIDESYNCGKNGRVYVFSQKGYGKDFSEYNADTNPLPFYIKRGFVPIDTELLNEAFSSVEKEDADIDLDKIYLVLHPEEVENFKEKYDNDSVYLED